MFAENQIWLIVVFSILLTIIMYGLAKSILKMSFGNIKISKTEFPASPLEHYLAPKHFPWGMYLPQIIFLTIALVLGLYMPPFINQLLNNAVSAITSI